MSGGSQVSPNYFSVTGARVLAGIAPDDPWTFAPAVACGSALPPAIRAARIEPMLALRHE